MTHLIPDCVVQPERRYELVIAVSKALRWEASAVVFPRLCLIGFTFAQPFLISRVVTWLREPATAFVQDEGYALIGATFVIYAGIAVSDQRTEA